jgi:hypothetical protein
VIDDVAFIAGVADDRAGHHVGFLAEWVNAGPTWPGSSSVSCGDRNAIRRSPELGEAKPLRHWPGRLALRQTRGYLASSRCHSANLYCARYISTRPLAAVPRRFNVDVVGVRVHEVDAMAQAAVRRRCRCRLRADRRRRLRTRRSAGRVPRWWCCGRG